MKVWWKLIIICGFVICETLLWWNNAELIKAVVYTHTSGLVNVASCQWWLVNISAGIGLKNCVNVDSRFISPYMAHHIAIWQQSMYSNKAVSSWPIHWKYHLPSHKEHTMYRGRFKNTYELLNQRALKFSYVNKIHIFPCMGKIFCVEFQRYPLKFHTKYLTHTLKDMIFMQFWNFKSS